MNMETFLELAKMYNDLGWAVQEQLHELDNGVDAEDMNPNALGMIANFLVYAGKRGLEGTDIILDAIVEAKFEEKE